MQETLEVLGKFSRIFKKDCYKIVHLTCKIHLYSFATYKIPSLTFFYITNTKQNTLPHFLLYNKYKTV